MQHLMQKALGDGSTCRGRVSFLSLRAAKHHVNENALLAAVTAKAKTFPPPDPLQMLFFISSPRSSREKREGGSQIQIMISGIALLIWSSDLAKLTDVGGKTRPA